MITTPVLRRFKPFNAKVEQVLKFDYRGGNQAVKNNLVIERVDNNSVVYNKEKPTFSLQHVLPKNTLTNGVNYRAKVRVADINNKWSTFSYYIIFWTFDDPTLLITNINYGDQNRIYHQTYTFTTTYTHPNSEVLQSYTYLLYDSNKDLITTFTPQYSDGTSPLTQEIAGLENGSAYHLEVATQSVNGQLSTSGLIKFVPFYIAPKLLTRLTPQNLPEQGAVKLSANILQSILKMYDNKGREISQFDIDYIDDDWIDMNRLDYKRIVAREGFEIDQSNFTMQIWCKKIPLNQVFLTLYSPAGRIDLKMYNNRIHALKYVHGLKKFSHFASGEFIAISSDAVSIMIRQVSNMIDVYAEVIQGGD